MSAVSYKKIFTIKITHDYFSNSIDGNIQILPGLITQQFKNRFDIQIQNIQGSCNIYINSESSTKEFLSHLESTTSNNYFDFNVQVSDPIFYNYTNIPIDSNASYLYESNASENNIDTSGTLLNPQINSVKMHNTFAQIKIHFQDIINNPSEEHVFLIAFIARAIFWQYYIISNSEMNLHNLSIKGNIDVFFEDAIQVTLDNGKQAIKFTTMRPLKLSESPKHHFDSMFVLLESDQFSEPMRIRLPSPNPSNLKTSNENGNQKVISPMYIYV